MKRILVTGGSGFIGRHCLKLLQEGTHEVHAISSKKVFSDQKIIWHKIDIFDFEKLACFFKQMQFDTLMHFAWYAEHGLFWSSEQNLRWVGASLELARLFALNGGNRCVIAGTCAEYVWDGKISNEIYTPLYPNTLYGIAKNSLRMILDRFFLQEKVSFCWGRIFYPYGPCEKSQRLIPFVIRSLLEKKIAECTQGEQLRDFMYIEEVAEIFVKLIDSSIEGAINVGSGQPISIKEVCNLIGDYMQVPNLLKMGSISNPKHDTALLVADTNRLENELNWRPKISIKEGLQKTINWWKEQSKTPVANKE